VTEFTSCTNFEPSGARAGDERPDAVGGQPGKVVADGHQHLQHELGLLGLVPLVVGPQDLAGFGIDHHRLDRGGAHVDANAHRLGAPVGAILGRDLVHEHPFERGRR
jgi:hypothetical protein